MSDRTRSVVIERAASAFRRPVVAGGVAGAVSTVVFTVIHDLTISDIWFSLPSMLIAGVLSGMSLAWTYDRIFRPGASDRRTLRNWIELNLIYDGMFVLLGLTSVAVLEPVTTMAAVLAANDFPRELVVQALPMTVVFGLIVIVILSYRYADRPIDYVSISITTIILVSVLGLNVSPIGLVEVQTSGLLMIGRMFGLIFVLNAVYVAVFALLALAGTKPS